MRLIDQISTRSLVALLLLCFAVPGSWAQVASDSLLKVSVGDIAPNFTLTDHNGSRVTLSDFRHKKAVVLAFYVFAFTRGCAEQLRHLQTLGRNPDVQVIGVSMDSIFANHVFATQLEIKYPLLSDKDGTVTRRYGLFNPTVNAARRAAIVVSKAGRIVDIELDQDALIGKKTLRVVEQLQSRGSAD